MHSIHLPEDLNAAAVFIDRHINEGRADKTAILCGDDRITYLDLYQKVNHFGNALLMLGVRMEERVVFLLPDCPEWVYVFFGTIKIGAVAIPVNTLLQPTDYEYLLNDSRASILLVHQSLYDKIEPVRDRIPYIKNIIVVDGHVEGCLSFDTLMENASPLLLPANTSKDDAAFWLYSSGTTGFPKGTIHLQHDMIIEAEYYAKKTIGLKESDISFSVAKLFFAYGLGNGLYFSLWVGGTTVLLPNRPLPQTVFDTIDRFEPSVFYSVPTSYAALLHLAEQQQKTSLGKVRLCISAGEPLPKPLLEKWRHQFNIEILDGIGSTEILHIFISNRPGRVIPGSTGEIVPGYEAKIVDEHEREVTPGEVGTLLIKGDSIANGYWNKHEQSKVTFRGEWINTHDKFSKDEHGYFWYAGRSDDMIKVSGIAVWPSEVESLLCSHPAVLESGVIGVPDEEGLIKPRAYVVLKDKKQASDDLVKELQNHVKSNSLPHKYPRSIIFIDELPKTATGKIQRYKLRKKAGIHDHPKTQSERS